MTRLFLAAYGCGFTSGIVCVALVGQLTCASLGFAAGVLSATCIFGVAGAVMFWMLREPTEHSQTLDVPPSDSPY